MNELQVLTYEGNEVRTVQMNDETLWILKDVCDVLGLSDTNKVAERLDDGELTRIKFVSGGQAREMYAVNESGLYNVILRSDKPEAKNFKHWVTHDVLPSIRKHGAYVTSNKLEEIMNDPDSWIVLLTKLKEERSKRAELEAQALIDKPKALFADSVTASDNCVLIRELAKLLRQNGVDIGGKRLYEHLRKQGYLIRQNGQDFNRPTQRAMDLGLFKVSETTILKPDGTSKICMTTKVTGKGQVYFLNKLKAGA